MSEDLNLLEYSDLEALEGEYKSSNYPYSRLSFWLTTIISLGFSLLFLPRWDEESIEDLKERINEKLEKEYKELDYTRLGGTGTESYIIAVQGRKLDLWTFKDKTEIEINRKYSFDLKEVRMPNKGIEIQIVDRESEEVYTKLAFNSEEKYLEFSDSIKSELAENGLYEYRGFWDEKEVIEDMKRADIGVAENFQNLSPYEFEDFIAKLFRAKGYDARKTSNSGDFGVDVITEKNDERVVVQAKRHKVDNRVGSPTVRDTLGSIHKANADRYKTCRATGS